MFCLFCLIGFIPEFSFREQQQHQDQHQLPERTVNQTNEPIGSPIFSRHEKVRGVQFADQTSIDKQQWWGETAGSSTFSFVNVRSEKDLSNNGTGGNQHNTRNCPHWKNGNKSSPDPVTSKRPPALYNKECSPFSLSSSIHPSSASSTTTNLSWRKVAEAAKNGNELQLLQLLQKKASASSIALNVAAAGGHVRCVSLLFSHGAPVTNKAIEICAAGGHFECLSYLCQHAQPTMKSALNAIRYGHIRCLQFLTEECKVPVSDVAVFEAVSGGYHDCLGFLLAVKKMPVTKTALAAAISRRFLNCVRIMAEFLCEDSLSMTAVQLAAASGCWESLNILLDKGAIISRSAVLETVRNENIECLKELLKRTKKGFCCREAVVFAVVNGNESILDMLLQHEAPISVAAVEVAAERGSHVMLEKLLVNGALVSQLALRKASSNGHSNCLFLMLKMIFPPTPFFPQKEGNGGWSTSRGCLSPSIFIDPDIVNEAAFNRQWDCVSILLNFHAPATSCALDCAAHDGILGLVTQLLFQNAIISETTFHNAIKSGSLECFRSIVNTSLDRLDEFHRKRKEKQERPMDDPASTQLTEGSKSEATAPTPADFHRQVFDNCLLSSLSLAVQMHSVDVINFLFDNGLVCPPNSTHLVDTAIEHAFFEVLSILLRNNAPVSLDAINKSIKRDRTECLNLLLQRQAPFSQQAFVLAVEYDRMEALRLLLQREKISTFAPVQVAVSKNAVAVLEVLLKNKAPVHSDASACALKNRNIEILTMLFNFNTTMTQEAMNFFLQFGPRQNRSLHFRRRPQTSPPIVQFPFSFERTESDKRFMSNSKLNIIIENSVPSLAESSIVPSTPVFEKFPPPTPPLPPSTPNSISE